jgi:branched-chain amino acid transport system permease protein
MAVGAYAAYNFFIRIPACRGGGHPAGRRDGHRWSACCSASQSLRIKGLYLAVATLAAQFFCDWAFLRIKWFTNDSRRAR